MRAGSGPYLHHQLPGREAPQTAYHRIKKQPRHEAEKQDGAKQKNRREEMPHNKKTLAALHHHLN